MNDYGYACSSILDWDHHSGSAGIAVSAGVVDGASQDANEAASDAVVGREADTQDAAEADASRNDSPTRCKYDGQSQWRSLRDVQLDDLRRRLLWEHVRAENLGGMQHG